MASSGSEIIYDYNTLNSGYTSAENRIHLQLHYDWEVISQDVENNSSTVRWSLRSTLQQYSTVNDIRYYFTLTDIYGNQSNMYIRYWYDGSGTYDIDQVIQVDGADARLYIPIGESTLFTDTVTIPHDSVDYQSFKIRLTFDRLFSAPSNDSWEYQLASWSSNNMPTPIITLDYIVRSASIVSLSSISITDEDSLTLTYSNPAGEYATVLQAGISLTSSDSSMAVPYRPLSKTGTSYTFNFSESELSNLYKVLDEGATSARLRLFLKSTVPVTDGSTTQTVKESRDITLTFINYKPTLNVQLKATDTTTLNATGDEKVFINGVSEVYFNLNPSVKKDATQAAIWIGNGGDDKYTASGTFTDITTDYFSAYLRDNRGYQVSQEIKLGEGDWVDYRWIDYFPLTVKVHQGLLDANGQLAVTLTGKFFNGDFGNKSNTFKYQYNIRKTTSGTDNWSSIISVSPNNMSLDNQGNYSYTFTIKGLDYTARYALTVDVIDEIMSEMAETSTVIGAIPVFDWSKDDFNFNVPVNFAAGFTQPNSALKQLWNGQYHMNGTTTSINLIESVSSQTNGLVLVFTPYDSSTGLANDEKLMSFFVSKKVVQVMPSKLHTFLLIPDASFSTIGAKSVYISDTKITGYAASGNSGTSKGVTFNNAGFVLRYVLGV